MTSDSDPCTFESVNEEGLQDGLSGRDPKDPAVRFKPCPSERKKRLTRVYLEGYDSALMQLCTESNVEAEARKAGKTGETRLAVCFAKFPELRQTFEKSLGEVNPAE